MTDDLGDKFWDAVAALVKAVAKSVRFVLEKDVDRLQTETI